MNIQEKLREFAARENHDSEEHDLMMRAAEELDFAEVRNKHYEENYLPTPPMNDEVGTILYNFLKVSKELAGIGIIAQRRDEVTQYAFHCPWRPVALIGEAECLKSAMVVYDSKLRRMG